MILCFELLTFCIYVRGICLMLCLYYAPMSVLLVLRITLLCVNFIDPVLAVVTVDVVVTVVVVVCVGLLMVILWW